MYSWKYIHAQISTRVYIHEGMRIHMSLKVYIFPALKFIFVQAVYQMLIVYTNVLVNSAVL